ncbi:MAG: hypothetical protein ABSE39_11500 [Candidatus Bathyarchaeia archaeon]|jgi:hypothetical protein
MTLISKNVLIISIIMVLALIGIEPSIAAPQIGMLQPGFNQAIVVLHQAESAGATSSEVSELVTLLNRALELNREALQPNTPLGRRTELLAQVDQILLSVEGQSAELTAISSQRAYRDELFTYAGAAVAAILGTIVYAFAASLYQKYRIKRTFQMKASIK